MTDDPPIDAVYDRIATHFSATRAYPWPEVESFLDGVAGQTGLDLGCGNGRHTEPLAAVVETAVGVDVSGELLAVARDWARDRDYDADFLQADAGTLPLASERVQVGVYVATIHHLRTREARIASLDELARVLSPDGIALVSAWSTAHDRFDETTGFDTTIDWTLPDGETVPRYYHIYDPGEFRADIDTSHLDLLEDFVSSGNCYARVRPTSNGENGE